jgi:hypothetical protein
LRKSIVVKYLPISYFLNNEARCEGTHFTASKGMILYYPRVKSKFTSLES